MSVLSIDLAYRNYRDIGVATLDRTDGATRVEFHPLLGHGIPTPADTAKRILDLASRHQSELILIDGPQAWKSPDSPYPHSRVCERLLNTPAKTGLPGQVKPANYAPFVTFSILVFEELESLGWPRLYSCQGPIRHSSAESFPLSAWRSLGIPILPAKAKAKEADITSRTQMLVSHFNLSLNRDPNHDELQALVSGLAGLPMLAGASSNYRVHGSRPSTSMDIPEKGSSSIPPQRETTRSRSSTR